MKTYGSMQDDKFPLKSKSKKDRIIKALEVYLQRAKNDEIEDMFLLARLKQLEGVTEGFTIGSCCTPSTEYEITTFFRLATDILFDKQSEILKER